METQDARVPSSTMMRLVFRASGLIARYKRVALVAAIVVVLVEATRVAWRGKTGDFGPVIAVVNRLAAGEPMYVGNETGPAYVYSPLFALLIQPLGILPDKVIRFLWYLLTWVLLAGSWRLAALILYDGERSGAAVPKGYWLLAIAPIWYFAYYNALNGQTTPLMMFLVILSYYLDRQGRQWLAGISLAGSMLIKPFPVIVLGFYLLRKRWFTMLSTGVASCVFLILPIIRFKKHYLEVLNSWMQVNRQQQTIYDISDWAHQSISSFWYRVFGRHHPPPFLTDPTDPVFWVVWLSIAALVGVTVMTTLVAARTSRQQDAHAAFAMYLLCWALLPPTSWKHYYILLLFPCALLAKVALSHEVGNKASMGVLGALFVGLILLHIDLPGIKHTFYEMSTCVFMGLLVFGLLTSMVAKSFMAQPSPSHVRATRRGSLDGEA